MPATYTIDSAAGMVRVACSGVFTTQEMIDCMVRLYRDPARTPGMPSLIDCREVETIEVTPAGAQAAAGQQRGPGQGRDVLAADAQHLLHGAPGGEFGGDLLHDEAAPQEGALRRRRRVAVEALVDEGARAMDLAP